MVNGLAGGLGRADKLRILGNGVVPQQAAIAFLMLENRSCVAMSRQQRLLIVFGDKEMFKNEYAQQAVPALANLVEICK